MYPIPVVYGLTCGELATMINEEGWLGGNARYKLTVIKMEGWKRSMLWTETGLNWIAPSPNIPTVGAAFTYPATCFVEATNVSEGRGTEKPFRYIGAPFINGEQLATNLNKMLLPGVKFSPVSFTPTVSKFKGERCSGIFVEVMDAKAFEPLKTGLAVIRQMLALYRAEVRVNKASFLRLMGSQGVYDALMNPNLPLKLGTTNDFTLLSSKYHLYK